MATLSSLLQTTLFEPSTGDVVGPVAATDNAIVRFDSTTGKLVQNSSVTIDDSGNVTANSFSGSFSGDGSNITGIVTTGKAIAMAIVFG